VLRLNHPSELMSDPAPHTAAKGSQEASSLIRVIGRLPLSLSDEERLEFERLTLVLAAITREKDQVISYSCNADIEAKGTYVFDEVWPSYEIFMHHLDTSHFKDWWAWVEPKVQGALAIDYVSLSHLTRV
jgi:quinol monooxygenase YgiN